MLRVSKKEIQNPKQKIFSRSFFCPKIPFLSPALIVCVLYTMMMSCFGRYNNASFLAKALLSALFLVVFQQSSSFFVAATARRPAASLNTHAIATDGGPRDFTAPARKAWVAETTTKKSTPTVGSQSSSEEVAQLGAGGNYFVHSSVRFFGCWSSSCSCSSSSSLSSSSNALDTFSLNRGIIIIITFV